MTASPWRIDAGLAADAAAWLGWRAEDGPEALVGVLGRRLAAGSMAKLAAVDGGEVPPGWDPAAVLRSILTDARVGRPSPSWSCWVFCTVYAALVETSGVGRCRVAVTRRIDERAPIVDLHSSVLVDLGSAVDRAGHRAGRRDGGDDGVDENGDGVLVVDPYFYVAMGGPGTDRVEDVGDGVWACRTDEAGGRWSYRVAHARWATPLRYRVIGQDVDREDVHAFCAVSVAFTGVTNRPSACLLVDGGMVDARETDTGTAVVRIVRAGSPGEVWAAAVERHEHPDWATAADELESLTGVALPRQSH